MKILLITPVHPKLKTKKPLPTYQTQNHWCRAIKKLGHQVIVFPLNKNSLKVINFLRVKKLIKKKLFDHVFFSAGIDKLYPIKSTVFFCGVPPKKISSSERKIALASKVIIVNDSRHQKQWQKLTKVKVVNLPYSAVDLKIFKPSQSKKIHDFVFVGTLFKNRQLQLIKLLKQNIDLKIWGWIPPSINLAPGLASFYQGEAWGSDVVNIYQQAKIGLNLTPDHMTGTGNLRTFEIPACKTLQLVDKTNSNYYQKNKEIITFNSPKDLKNKLKFFLSNSSQREKIIQTAYQKTIKAHTFKHRFSKILKLV